MIITKYKELGSYEVISAIKEGKQVMCLNRASADCFLLNKMSIEKVVELLKDAKELEDATHYPYISQYDFFYGEIVEEEDAECKAE